MPSWNDGKTKQSIIAFVEKVTKLGSPDFVPVPERIATFDNDGTLWCEQPMPVQFYFALEPAKQTLTDFCFLAYSTQSAPRANGIAG